MVTPSQDVTLKDENADNFAAVGTDLALQTKARVWDGTTTADVVAATGTPVKNRLAVDANISSGSISIDRFTPKFSLYTTATVLTTAGDTSLISVTANGKIDSISFTVSNSNGIFILKIDAVEVLRINISDVADTGIYDLGVVGAFVAVGCIAYARGASHLILQWMTPVDFTTSFEILGKASATTSTIKGILVGHRVKV